ncbi:hypothetical protein JCM14036_10430 [Desulfotomaculum defluvii]
MRKINRLLMRSISLLLIFSFFLNLTQFVPSAEATQEKVICTYIGSGYSATWKVDGQFYADFGQGIAKVTLGGNYHSSPFTFAAPVPSSTFSQYYKVRAVAMTLSDSDMKTYMNALSDNQTHGFTKVIKNLNNYQNYYNYYLGFEADNCNTMPTQTVMNSDYSVTTQWQFDLGPMGNMSGGNKKAIDLITNNTGFNVKNYYTPTWESAANYAEATEAYLWSLPIVITWYGTPKSKHDLQFTENKPQLSGGIVPGKTVTGSIGIKNLSSWPTISEYTKLRVYTWQEGASKPDFHNTYPVSLDGLSEDRFNFSFQVPPKPFKLILTANIDMASGSQVNEFLQVTTDSGPLSKPEEEYILNKVEVPLAPVDENDNTQPANLAVTSVQLYNSSGSPVSGTIKEGQSYKVKVTYSSSFDVSGYAELGLYYKDSLGNVKRIGDNPLRQFSPNGVEEKEWSFNASSGKGKLIAVINLKWLEGEKFENQLFEGQTETTYSDNIKEVSTTVSDGPLEPPPPGSINQPLYYHPVVTKMFPVYKTVTETTFIPEVKKVRFIKDKEKYQVRTRIIR